MSGSKTLFLTRHAKSSWAEAGLLDKQRPLNKRGFRDAPLMGKYISAQDVVPQRIVSSPALRALTTAKLIGEKLAIPLDDIILDERIYMAYPSELMDIIHHFDSKTDNIMLVGHNPTMTELVNQFVSADIDNVPTCGVAIIQFATHDWRKAKAKNARLIEFIYPKKLK